MKGADIVRTAQEKFDVAREHYQKAMQHIETITTICEKAAKGTDLFLKNQFDAVDALLKLRPVVDVDVTRKFRCIMLIDSDYRV